MYSPPSERTLAEYKSNKTALKHTMFVANKQSSVTCKTILRL